MYNQHLASGQQWVKFCAWFERYFASFSWVGFLFFLIVIAKFLTKLLNFFFTFEYFILIPGLLIDNLSCLLATLGKDRFNKSMNLSIIIHMNDFSYEA